MSVFAALTMISLFLEVVDKGEKLAKFWELTKRVFSNIINIKKLAQSLILWFTSLDELPSFLRLGWKGNEIGLLSIREYFSRVEKFKVGDLIEIEGVFSRFFPLIIDPKPDVLISDLKIKLKDISEKLNDYLKELRKIGLELYPEEFQKLLNLLEFGDEFRFRTTAVIRDFPVRYRDKYLYVSALYPNRATVNLGAIPIVVISNEKKEPSYHTFYARLRGRIGEVMVDNRAVKIIIIDGWSDIENLGRDSILYLSQWVLVKAQNSKEAFPKDQA